MKKLYLVRHAKSSWKLQVSDIKRPLKKRGISDAELIAKQTNELFVNPDMVLSSPSKRTVQTAEIFINSWELNT